MYSTKDKDQLRALFMAHAPFPVPNWFEPVVDAERPTDRVSLDKWTLERTKQTLIQWPRYWAELMLEQIDA